MPWPPDEREAPPGGDGASSKIIAVDNSDRSDTSLEIPVSQLRPRQIGPGELAHILAYRERWRRLRVLPGGQP